MPRLAGIVDMRDDLRAEMSMAQSLGEGIGTSLAGLQIRKEKKLAETREGILNQNVLYAAKNKLGPEETLDLLLKTDEFAKSKITQDALRYTQRQVMGGYGQSPEQENQLLGQLTKYDNLRKSTIDEITGKPIAGREKEFEFFDKKTKEIVGRLQGNQGAFNRFEERKNQYMQQSPELQPEQPKGIAPIISQVEQTGFMKSKEGRRDPEAVRKATELYEKQKEELGPVVQPKEQVETKIKQPSTQQESDAYDWSRYLMGSGDMPKIEGLEQAALPVKVNSEEEYKKLTSGSLYIAPDGTIRRKP